MTSNTPSFFANIEQGISKAFEQPFNLRDIKDFPYSEYQTNLERYQKAAEWYYGDALSEINTSKPGEPVPLYPVRINPLQAACQKHGAALFGEGGTDDGRPLVVPKLIFDGESDTVNTKAADQVLSQAWYENSGKSLMTENGIVSQIYGGCVFGLRYVPDDVWRLVKIQIERIAPECFLGYPIPGDEFRLKEAWIVKPITVKDAANFGVKLDENDKAFWIEHWTLDQYEITINNKPIKYIRNGVEYPSKAANIWGVVPFVYIPHIRAGKWYGVNLIDNVMGIVAELNLRVADYGDAVNADAHSYVATRNVTGHPIINKLAPGLETVDLGSNAGITGNEPDPDIWEIRKPAASTSMKDLVEVLTRQFRRDAYVPAIADGEDEGSQRSALTLAMRMWPLISHINTERAYWTDGLNWFNSMILRFLNIKGQNGITPEHLKCRIKESWQPILPKDRETFMNELVERMRVNLGSPDKLLELTGEVEDIDGEMEKIRQWLEFNAKLKQPAEPPEDKEDKQETEESKEKENGS